MEKQEVWVFGYGSLVWKNNDFEYELKAPGFIKGFNRRFYQNSIDHRGVPEKPGRVVTLVKADEGIVYGMGYRIADSKATEVLDHLDYREKNGYEKYETLFYPIDGSPAKPTIVYVANEQNPSWNPNHDIEDIARQIFYAVGPSGRNPEYVINLCDAMREFFHNISDEHLNEIERKLRDMEAESNKIIVRRLSQEG